MSCLQEAVAAVPGAVEYLEAAGFILCVAPPVSTPASPQQQGNDQLPQAAGSSGGTAAAAGTRGDFG